MDGRQFDILLRAITDSRRSLLGGLATTMFGAAALTGTAAKGKKHKKKKVALCLNGQPLSVKKNKQSEYLAQGATAGACPPAVTCSVGQKPCEGRCLPSNQCCVDTDCASATPRCCRGACLRASECCGNVDCAVGMLCESGTCRCAGSAVSCGAGCCVAPAGLPVTQVSCSTQGAPTCICTVRASDVCPPGCPAHLMLNLPCANATPDMIENHCLDIGCD